MKKIKKKYFYFLLLAIFCLFLTVRPSNAQHQEKQEKIADWQAVIDISPDASLKVRETIIYDFGTAKKHGLYRDIPFKYKRQGLNYNLRLSEFKVTNKNGRALKFSLSQRGKYKRLKIGDPNRLVSGRRTYVISYRVERALNYFSDYDELYWNATGNEWSVEIAQARIVVNLPKPAPAKAAKTACYAGQPGSKSSCLSTRYIYSGADQVKSFSFTNGRLRPGEGLTVVVGWPKGLVQPPSRWQKFFAGLTNNWFFGLPVVVFFVLLYLWFTRGRGPAGQRTIIARYAPPAGMTPAMVGTIVDERLENRDITAEIIYLASQGYLRLIRLPKQGLFKKSDWLLVKRKEPGNELTEYEIKLMRNLFSVGGIKASLKELRKILPRDKNLAASLDKEMVKAILAADSGQKSPLLEPAVVKLSCLQKDVVKELIEISKDIYQQATAKGYFRQNPNRVRRLYFFAGFLAIMISGWLGGQFLPWPAVISLWLSGILVIIFGFFMPARTRAGEAARNHILGLKEYLSVAEKDRLKFHNAPEKNPRHFEELLPYAIALGVEKEWAAVFADIYRGQPDWYYDSSGRAFTAPALVGSLSSFHSQARSVFTSAGSGRSGFGGGAAGGGFGGGGGGSW